MKRLTILRHAKSSWKFAKLADRERPLSDRGEQDAPTMAARMLARKARPSLIISSPAVRALTTAKIVANTLSYPLEFLQTEKGLYMASAGDILDIVATQEDNFSDLLVVGHNPGMTDLANVLLPDLALANIPTAGMLAVDFATDRWSDVPGTPGKLAYYDYPKNPELLVIED